MEGYSSQVGMTSIPSLLCCLLGGDRRIASEIWSAVEPGHDERKSVVFRIRVKQLVAVEATVVLYGGDQVWHAESSQTDRQNRM